MGKYEKIYIIHTNILSLCQTIPGKKLHPFKIHCEKKNKNETFL